MKEIDDIRNLIESMGDRHVPQFSISCHRTENRRRPTMAKNKSPINAIHTQISFWGFYTREDGTRGTCYLWGQGISADPAESIRQAMAEIKTIYAQSRSLGRDEELPDVLEIT